MNRKIEIVSRGRGPQLSTSRVTVQDLVPYLQEGCSHEEIRRWIPCLSHEEISVIESYYREHREILDEESRDIRERAARRKNPPWVEQLASEAREERHAKLAKLTATQSNGEPK